MPGKHAPESSASFILSLSKAVGGALAAVAVMTILVVALLNRGDAEPQSQGPTVLEPTGTAAATSPSPTPSSPTPKPSPTVLAPNKVTVQVLNGGTGRTGLAAQTAQEIEKEGYKLAGTGNAPRTDKSTIFYRKGHRAEALAFQRLFPDFTVLEEAPSSQSPILKVVIGADWPQG